MIRIAIVALVVAGAAGYLVLTATQGSADYYLTVAQMRAHPVNANARVLGTVQPDVQHLGGLHIRFTESYSGASMPVDYTGPVPDIFKPGIDVVVEGNLGSDGVFHAATLLAKCPSRFSTT